MMININFKVDAGCRCYKSLFAVAASLSLLLFTIQFAKQGQQHHQEQEPSTTMPCRDQFEVMHTLRSEFAKKGESPWKWRANATPAEREIFTKYRQRGQRRAAVGGLVGASAMAGVWRVAALSTGFGVTGVIVGGVIGAGVSMRTSGIRREMFSEFLTLPEDKSPRAAEARKILQTKLPNNLFVQELMKNPVFAGENAAVDTVKDK